MPIVVVVEIPTETAVQVHYAIYPAEDFYQPCVVVRTRTRSTRSFTSSAIVQSMTSPVYKIQYKISNYRYEPLLLLILRHFMILHIVEFHGSDIEEIIDLVFTG